MGGGGSKVTPFTARNDPVDTLVEGGDKQELEERIKELEREIQLKDEACQSVEEKLRSAEEQVESLQSEVSQLQQSVVVTVQDATTNQSSLALEHMVAKLGRELASAKDELLLMQEKYERRLQRVRSSSAKSQAESALSLFELRDENQKLSQENANLFDQIRQLQSRKQCSHDSANHEGGQDSCGHMQLIIDLSQQLSTQEAELKNAKHTIQEMQHQIKVHS